MGMLDVYSRKANKMWSNGKEWDYGHAGYLQKSTNVKKGRKEGFIGRQQQHQHQVRAVVHHFYRYEGSLLPCVPARCINSITVINVERYIFTL